jgi:deoxyribodipyrimidine photo-lyase
VLSPVRQAKRFDPDGVYVRRWVPELEPLETGAIHEPWRLGARRPRGYPAPLVDHDEAVRRFRRARGLDG